MKLNLGSGEDYRLGWVNLDYNEASGPDVVWDMTKLPLPFKDNTFDEIIMIHVLEHFYNPLEIINELWRIGKPGCKITIKVPHWSCHFAYGDLTHKSYFSSRSFSHFNLEKEYYNKEARFSANIKLNCLNARGRFHCQVINALLNPLLNLSFSFTENLLCRIFPIYEIINELTVEKKETIEPLKESPKQNELKS